MLNGKSILVTGGTGSFGQKFIQIVLSNYQPKRVIVYSRDEFKQAEMQKDPSFHHPAIRFFLGDVRDQDRLSRAMEGVDVVIHCAALKQVPAAEYNPHEFIKTNINGAMHVVDAALNNNVSKVIALSTDKAVNPINLYGATKLCSDKIFIAANSYRGKKPTQFSVVRYGNVAGSRGSVIPRFLQERPSGTLTVTHPDMTRFYLSLDDAANFVIQSLSNMSGGEIFIPKLASCSLRDIANVVAPTAKYRIIGIRPGEKMHEVLIPSDEAHLTLEFDNYFIIQPTLPFWQNTQPSGKPCSKNFSYDSSNNPLRLSHSQIQKLCEEIEISLNLQPDLSLC